MTSLTVNSVRQLLYWIHFKEKQTAKEVQEQLKVKEQGAKKKHGNEDLESKKKAPKKAKKEPITQPCMPDLIKSTQQAKEVCKLRSLNTYLKSITFGFYSEVCQCNYSLLQYRFFNMLRALVDLIYQVVG